ncbi:hypothetical protein NE298_12225 [Lactococcus lactis]|uniref:Uncharacterized protein n=1 Tax=Lactococcus lactis subsp. lactis TaxID=1360 RepID=A0A1V0NCG0_LACLL|nr:hypothetical protein [Lactococcus lactis]MRL86581.1 hypothetical protein [Lactococcus cremoris]ARD97617.1 hypothetical protein LL275_pD39 [Lactococcus lactis subsp. lactis]MCM6847481.1 hypothetical protein [Lactococcus lactis]MCT0027565.1 hypothetical protein [Lactococcus lactis subsp. lactis]MCT3105610.1 hypothetical protein [Lactococcus lactis]
MRVGIVVFNKLNKTILLVKNKKDMYEIPNGKLMRNEQIESVALRIANGELKLDISENILGNIFSTLHGDKYYWIEIEKMLDSSSDPEIFKDWLPIERIFNISLEQQELKNEIIVYLYRLSYLKTQKIVVSINSENNIIKDVILSDFKNKYSEIPIINDDYSEKLFNSEMFLTLDNPRKLTESVIDVLKQRSGQLKKLNSPVVILGEGYKLLRAKFKVFMKLSNFSEVLLKKELAYLDSMSKQWINFLEIDSLILDNKAIVEDRSSLHLLRKELEIKTWFIVLKVQNSQQKFDKFIDEILLSAIEKLSAFEAQSLSTTIYGVTGLSESGKSSLSHYVDSKFSIWNIKFRSFIEISKGIIGNSESSIVDTFAIYYFIIFLRYNYYKKEIWLDSVYSKNFHESLKKFFLDKYKLVYLDVSQNTRLNRSEDSVDDFFAKDNKKILRGVEELKNQASFVVDNERDILQTKSFISNILEKRFTKKLKTKTIDELGVAQYIREVLNSIYGFIMKNYGEQCMLFSFVGSIASETFIDNWSDIDILLILKNKKDIDFLVLRNFISNLPIHVGFNIFDTIDIEKNNVDIKNSIVLYKIQNQKIFPQFITETIFMKEILLNDIIQNEEVAKNEILLQLNQILIEGDFGNIRKIFKLCLIVYIADLLMRGIITTSYQEIVHNLSKIDYDLAQFLDQLSSNPLHMNEADIQTLIQRTIRYAR